MEDRFYASIAFPYGLFVASVFWTLYAIDRELVFPEILDRFVSPALNHMMHTT